METLDDQFLGNNSPISDDEIRYVGLWPRVGAYLLDFVVLAPFSIGLTYCNIIMWKSLALLLTSFLLVMAYRPVMEHLYGHSLGKKWLRLQVINKEGNNPTWPQVMWRNIFVLALNIFSLVTAVVLFFDADFAQVRSYTDYITFITQHNQYNWIQNTLSFVLLVDAIVLWRDKQKRSLHDKIARTWVVKP